MTTHNPFTTTLQKSIDLLAAIEKEMGWPAERREQSYTALRVVLHALRDRLTVTEAVDLAAQLTPLIRGIYFEGWKPSDVPQKMDRDTFLNRVQNEFTYDVSGSIEDVVQAVITALRTYVSDAEMDDVQAQLPDTFESLFN